MINYLDEVYLLNDYALDHYKKPLDKFISENDNKNNEEYKLKLREMQSKHYGAREAILRCSENPLRDPIDTLDEIESEFQNISLWDCKQEINKIHYQNAALAAKELQEYIIKERRR